MNLEFPFAEHDAALDEQLAALDLAVEPLFLADVKAELERIRAERAAREGESVA